MMGVKSNHQYRLPWNCTRVSKKSKNQSQWNWCLTFKAVKRRWQYQGTRPGATFCDIPTGHETRLMLTLNTIHSTLTLLFPRCRSSYAAYVNAGYSRCRPKRAGINPVLLKTAPPIHISSSRSIPTISNCHFSTNLISFHSFWSK